MKQDEEIKKDIDEQDDDDLDYEVNITNCITNLASAYNSMMEIDPLLSGKAGQVKLNRMKKRILDAIEIYCEFLPRETET